MNPLQITDSISGFGGGGAAHGSVASRLLASGFNVNALRTLGTLRKDEWVAFDNTVVDIARRSLGAVGDLLSRGLRYNLPNALGTTRVEWERISDMDPAMMTMSGISESQNDRVVYDLQGLPVPIIHKDFNINIRALAASRNNGQGLDTTQLELSTRKVAELIETMLFNGATVLGTNNLIYGFTTAPARNTGSLTASWMTATGEQMVGDVLRMIGALVADNMYGPYVLYTSTNVYVKMGADYKANGDKTILDRLKGIPNISEVIPTKDLADGQVLLIQLTRDVVDIIDGMQPTIVEWESHGGMVSHYKVMAIMLPRIRSDFAGQSGIAHYSA